MSAVGRIDASLVRIFKAGVRPPPDLTINEWADQYRVISGKAASEPGRYRSARTPYAIEVMRALSPTSSYETIAWCAAAQISKTEVALNTVGFTADQDPGPILWVWPSLDLARRNSRHRIEPMFQDTPCLRNKLKEKFGRDANNTVLMKDFPGGMLILVGANSAASMRSTPVRLIIGDEVDRFPLEVEDEGDPFEQMIARQSTFARAKRFFIGSPTVAGLSAIERICNECERAALYFVPCPLCGFYQVLTWPHVVYPKPKKSNVDVISDARYMCESCENDFDESAKEDFLAAGEWRYLRDDGDRSIAFHTSSLYSPPGWISWGRLAARFERAKRSRVRLKAFVNTALAECWVETSKPPDWEILYARREDREFGVVPPGVYFLTAAVDVQADRLEIEVCGWGKNLECWSIHYHVFDGDTQQSAVWARLTEEVLFHAFPRAGGNGFFRVRVMAVDSGWNTKQVYAYVRRFPQPAVGPAGIAAPVVGTVIATKGTDKWGQIVFTPQAADATERGIRVFSIGASLVKSELYGFLRNAPLTDEARERGEQVPFGYRHHPMYGEDFFKQITSEVLQRRMRRGFPVDEWILPSGARNEALDTAVMNRVAASVFGIDRFVEEDWKGLEKQVAEYVRTPEEVKPEPSPKTKTRPVQQGAQKRRPFGRKYLW